MAFVIKTGRTAAQRLEEIGLLEYDVLKAINDSETGNVLFTDEEDAVETAVPKTFRLIAGKDGYHAITWESGKDKYTVKSMDLDALSAVKSIAMVRTASCWLTDDDEIAVNVSYEAWVGQSNKYTKKGVECTREALKALVVSAKGAAQLDAADKAPATTSRSRK